MTLEELEHNFRYHAPNEGKVVAHEMIRSTCFKGAKLIFDTCVECPERTLAIRKLEEAVMWANAAIARYPMEQDDG